jgi:hypothetical protein
MSLLEEVPDPRRAQGKLYKLPCVLLFPFSPSSRGANHHTHWVHGHCRLAQAGRAVRVAGSVNAEWGSRLLSFVMAFSL